MDAKSKANFINSVAGGNGIPCPNCGRLNNPNGKFCVACGTQLKAVQTSEQSEAPFPPAAEADDTPASTDKKPSEPAFEQVLDSAEQKAEKAAFKPEPSKPSDNHEAAEPKSAFALGLPDWNIEPPQVMVRRRSKK